jgi:hypothetical protein
LKIEYVKKMLVRQHVIEYSTVRDEKFGEIKGIPSILNCPLIPPVAGHQSAGNALAVAVQPL